MIKSRQLEILLFLLKSKKTTYGELAHRFEVSVKTIERDINSLSLMNIPVYCVQGSGGGVYLDESYKLSTSFFTNEDIHNIVFALSVFDSFSQKSHKADIVQKLCLIAPQLTALFEADAQDYLVVDLVAEKITIETPLCQAINQALDDEVLLEIAVDDSISKIAPISYVLKPEGLYLYGFTSDYRLLALTDITYFTITTTTFDREFTPYQRNKNYSR